MPAQRILVLFNEPALPPDHPDAASEHEIVEVADLTTRILREAGFAIRRLGVSSNLSKLLTKLHMHRPDAVFNLFEGLPDPAKNEACIASLLEWQGIPFTGSPAQALYLARHKPLTKTLLQGAGLPTPEFSVIDRLPLTRRPRRFPVIVKPGFQDASLGIDQGSVVRRSEQLTQRIASLLEQYGPPVLVERYIPGREFNVSVLEMEEGPCVLPLAEIQFGAGDASTWPIVTYDAKWRTETEEYRATPRVFPRELDPALAQELRTLAVQAYGLLGCRDYARIDFRVSPAGKPYILEVNPNPGIHPEAGFPAAVEASGLSYDQFIVRLVRAALGRGSACSDRRHAVEPSDRPNAVTSNSCTQEGLP